MLASLPTLLALAVPPQDNGDVIAARFRYADGTTGAVTRRELARDVGARHRRTDEGEEARKLLIDRRLVSIEAAAASLTPTPAEIAARIEQVRQALSAQGLTLESFLEQKRMSWDDFEQNYIALSIAHERLLLKSLGVSDPTEVTPELLELWLREARNEHRVELDEAVLPAGVIARVDGRSIDLAELGEVLLPNLPTEERGSFIRRIVLRELLQREADREGIKVTKEDTLAEIQERKQKVENDPSFRGIRYEDWLMTTTGMTVDELARSGQMVATVQQKRLVQKRIPRAELDRRLREDRDAVLRRHGEKRRLSIVLLRALDAPNQLVPRTFEQARVELAALRETIEQGEQSFHRIAAIHSEDPYSKTRGGELGEFARGSPELSEDMLAAAFALEPLEVSEPIRVPQGYVLVKVTNVIPVPDDAELIRRLREDVGQELLAEMLEAAAIEVSN